MQKSPLASKSSKQTNNHPKSQNQVTSYKPSNSCKERPTTASMK